MVKNKKLFCSPIGLLYLCIPIDMEVLYEEIFLVYTM